MNMINPIFRRQDMGACYKPLIKYYQSCVDKVIRDLRTVKVSKGIMIWKLHSSGIIIKTPKTIFAIEYLRIAQSIRNYALTPKE